MSTATIHNVSDTARWVAAYRAWESARPDAIFVDPYAARLAGERGEAMARAMGTFDGSKNGWPLITRTKVLDDMVLAAVAEGCTTVLNLAAGLDTRPYRMDLPPGLRWIEADLPAMVDEKESVLAGEQPRCRLERVRVDLADPAARAALFDRVDADGGRVLVMTEGLVVYLEEEVVAALARDLAARTSFAWWALDFSSPAILRQLQKTFGPNLQNAPMKFGPAGGLTFFEALGWRGLDVKSLPHEAARLRRVPWWLRMVLSFVPPADARALGNARWSGVVRLQRA